MIDAAKLEIGLYTLVIEAFNKQSNDQVALKTDFITISIKDFHRPPTFSAENLDIEYLEPLVYSQWTLPSIVNGTEPLANIIFEPHSSLVSLL